MMMYRLRVDEQNRLDALISSIPETRHALYELGIDSKFGGTPLHQGVSIEPYIYDLFHKFYSFCVAPSIQ